MAEQITITLRLSESLLCILRDAGSERPESIRITLQAATTVKHILADQGINPLLVPMVSLDQNGQSRRVDMYTPISSDGTLTLYGPLAGG